MPPNVIVVDPFLGRDAMGIAAGRLGHDFEGTGQGPECAKIAEEHIAYWGEDNSKILFSFTLAKALFSTKLKCAIATVYAAWRFYMHLQGVEYAR